MRHTGISRYRSGGFPQPPAQVKANGLAGTLVFSDDFTTNAIATTQFAASGSLWYWGIYGVGPPNPWTVNQTTLAKNVANGDNGTGGPYASPNGGILTVTGGVSGTSSPDNAALSSIPGWSLNNGSATLPVNGCWGKGTYWEAYIQTNVSNIVGPVAEGWPAFWLLGAEGLTTYGMGSSALNATITESDIVEIFNTQFSDPAGSNAASIHQPAGSTTVDTVSYSLCDANWHKYGFLWIAGTGMFYKDDVQVLSFSTSGLSMETASQHMFIILGCGIQSGGQMNIDYVNVWQ